MGKPDKPGKPPVKDIKEAKGKVKEHLDKVLHGHPRTPPVPIVTYLPGAIAIIEVSGEHSVMSTNPSVVIVRTD